MTWFRRFLVRGVFWRQFLRFAVLSVPLWLEPVVMAFWTGMFLFWRGGRRGVMRNLEAILPGSSRAANLFRAYRVFWNFAWTITDSMRFKEMRISPDWEFSGLEHFRELELHEGGAIILTAHMGNYDLGAQLFAELSDRQIVMVRAPEADPLTNEWERQHQGRTTVESLKIDLNAGASERALDLLDALRRGEIIAIQGDRMVPGIGGLPATLFGLRTELPAGPFALAMATGVPIYPLFIFRLGHRRYRLLVRQPFHVVRTRNRGEAFDRAVSQWTSDLEFAVRSAWFQWFAFEPFSEERAR